MKVNFCIYRTQYQLSPRQLGPSYSSPKSNWVGRTWILTMSTVESVSSWKTLLRSRHFDWVKIVTASLCLAEFLEEVGSVVEMGKNSGGFHSR